MTGLAFDKQDIHSRILMPDGRVEEKRIEIRTNPITGRTCRVTFSRAQENEPGADRLPEPPPFADDTSTCPFCTERVETHTPGLVPELAPEKRLKRGDSILFPNLFPYGAYSAVSLFDDRHFVEIGTASVDSYANCLLNCADYLKRIRQCDPPAIYLSITQNHLPSAGGSLLHPHLQVQADRAASNHHRFLGRRSKEYFQAHSSRLFGDYLKIEKAQGDRYIGETGAWEWIAAFAPEGFYELWAILPGVTSIRQVGPSDWHDLARGIINAQKFYRSLNRNGYNLGLLFIEDDADNLDLRVIVLVRSNYSPWARNDHTGFEVMLGDMATFSSPEQTAELARPFWLGRNRHE